MEAQQLEFNLEDRTELQLQVEYMRKHIDDKCESMDKVRRKLFSELGELKKVCFRLMTENEELKAAIKEIRNEKTEWEYAKGDYLFNVREYQESTN